jgi:hypothetical protein
MAEELTFEKLLGQGGARDVDERFRCTLAVVVNRLRGEILPGSRLASQQDGRGRAGRNAFEQRLRGHHGR